MRYPLTLLLTAVLLTLSCAATTTAAADESTQPPQLELNSYMKDFAVSTAVAEEHLAIQQRGAGIVEQLESTLGSDYAGVWFDNESGEFVIPMVGSAKQVSSVMQADQIDAHSRITKARYTWMELEAVQSRLTQSLQSIFNAELLQSEIDPISNSVVLEAASGATKAQEAKIRAALAKEAPAAKLESKTVAKFKTPPLACNTAAKVCDRPLRGGVYIEPAGAGTSGPSCTAGFKAIGKEFGNRFVLTAGHCYATGIQDWSSWDGTKLEEHYIGHINSTAQAYPTHDWAAIRVNGYSTYWEEKTTWPSEVAYWGVNQDLPIQYESGSYVGESVCHSGWTTGSTCGTVTSIDKTITSTGDCPCGTVEHLTKVEGPEFAASAGDSGGPVWAGNTALGLLTNGELLGGGPTNVAYYIEITEATDALGVTVGSRLVAPPSAATEAASEIQGRQVTGNAKVDANGLSTSYNFTVLPVGEAAFATESLNAGASFNPVGVNQVIGGLKPLHNYDYYVSATNSAGTSQSPGIKNFETSTAAPLARTLPAKKVIHQEAQLIGEVEGGGLETTTKFEYGLSGQYEKSGTYEKSVSSLKVSGGPFNVGWKAAAVTLSGLEDGLYHFRYVATNAKGTAYGEDQTFLIDNRPLIQGTTATNIKSGSATLKGEIEPQNFASTYHFELVRDSEFKEDGFTYAKKVPIPDASAGTGFEYHAVSQETGTLLEPDTVYHYRLVATNVKGTRIGEEKTFQTRPVTPVSDLTFGTPGSEGQLSKPQGLGEGESGSLWVADTGHSRLEKFSPEGTFISSFGKLGPGHGEFLNVNDVAILAGSIWAVDSGRDQLLSFSPIGQWGWEWGSTGSGNGQFESPGWISASEGAFRSWVSDSTLHRVQEFNENGQYKGTITGGSGNGPALEGPTGLQYDVNSGSIWVADSIAGRVIKYSGSSRKYLGSVGENGTGTGQLHHPGGVAILPSGDVVVSDGDPGGGNSRIQVFSSTGEYLGTFAGPQGPSFNDLLYSGGYLYATEWGEGVSQIRRWHFPQAKATSGAAESVRAEKAILTGTINPWGTKTSYRFEYGTTKAYGSQQPVPDRALESETGAQEAEQEITGLLPATTYHYRLVATNSNGVGYGQDMTFKTTSAKAPSVSNEAPSVIGVSQATFKGTVNPNGVVTTYRFEYADAAHWAVNHFGSAQLIPVPNKEIGSGKSPVAVSQTATSLLPRTLYHVRLRATNAEGTVDSENRTFTTPSVFQPPTYSSAFGSKGTANGQFEEPRGIATDPSANVWVSDLSLNRVQKFNAKGEYVCQIGAKGSGNGQFSSPRGLASDASGNVWVADTANNRIEEINSECKYVAQIGKAGSANGQLSSPKDVAVDPSGNIWVADSANSRIEKFNAKGEYLAKCGSKGTTNGQFEKEALSVDTDADANVYAGDEAGRIEEFDSKCAFLAKFDKTSSGAPAKVQPAPSTIDPEGNIWIPGAEAHGVQGFYPEGEYLASFGKEGTGEGQFTEPTAIAAAPDGTLWTIDHSSTANRIEKWVPGKAYAVQTGRAASVKRTEATLTGKVNPEGKATSYQFEYGTTTAFGSVVPATPKSVGSGSSPVAVSEFLDGLKAGTTYYYHLVAISGTTTTYGETRHFTTLAKPGLNAKWRIGGQTFAELGLEKATAGLYGTLRIHLSIIGLDVEIDCEELGSATLTPSGVTGERVILENCDWVGAGPECTIKPLEYTVNASYVPESPVILSLSEGCSFFENHLPLEGLSGSLEYGSEGKKLNVNTYATAAFGKNPETITSDSQWYLLGEQFGKTLGLEEGPPEVFSQTASKVGPTVATLNGTVNPLGKDTAYRFEYGPTTAYGTITKGGEAGSGTTALAESEALSGLIPATTYHYRIAASSNAGTTYGKDMTFTTPAQPNPNWRIEGSSLEELEAWGETYESKGTFEVQTSLVGVKLTVTCKESGSGTLGYSETMNLSECAVKSEGETQKCIVKATKPIELDSTFHSKNTSLTTLKFEGECPLPESNAVKAGPGLSFKAGAEAVEFPASMAEETYVGAETVEHKAQLSISSVWKLTGKYAGKKFAYAELGALNSNWHIKGAGLAGLGAWEPYESKGTFEVQTSLVGVKLTVTCKESGSGTLGYSETMNLSECAVKSEGGTQKCIVKATKPIELDSTFHSKNTSLTTLKFEGECPLPESNAVKAGPGLSFKAGAEAVEFPASMAEETYVGAETVEHKAQLSISSVWKLTGKYAGSKFGYE